MAASLSVSSGLLRALAPVEEQGWWVVVWYAVVKTTCPGWSKVVAAVAQQHKQGSKLLHPKLSHKLCLSRQQHSRRLCSTALAPAATGGCCDSLSVVVYSEKFDLLKMRQVQVCLLGRYCSRRPTNLQQQQQLN